MLHSRRRAVVVLITAFFVLTCVVLPLSGAEADARGVWYPIVKRTSRYVIVQRQHVRLLVRHHRRYVIRSGVRLFSVKKRTSAAVFLVKVRRAAASTSPSPAPSPVPSPSATPGPTPTPTPSPSPTTAPDPDAPATPSPAPSPTPSPTTIPSPEPTPTAMPAPVPDPPSPVEPLPIPNVQPASFTVNVRDYGARGDGSSDDSTAVRLACQTAASANGGTVYFPIGTYFMASRLDVPDRVSFVGEGVGSWLKAPFTAGSHAYYGSMRIGCPGRAAFFGGVTNVVVRDVQFTGGGGAYSGTWPVYDSHVLTIGGGGETSRLLFEGCRIERNLGEENESKSRHFDNVFITGGNTPDAPRTHDVTFRNTHFGVANSAGRVGGPRFHVEIWEDHSIPNRVFGFSNINFETDIFEAAESASIDYAGASTSADPTVPASGFSHVTDCTFKGNGAGSNPMWCGDVISEQGAGYIVITGNRSLAGYGGALNLNGAEDDRGPSGGHYVVRDNLVDATLTGCIALEGPWMSYVAVNGNWNVITGNSITTPRADARWPNWQYDALTMNGDDGVVTGNIVRGGKVSVNGQDNVTAPNTVLP